MNNPDFLISQKKSEYHHNMLKELEVPFEEMPNFLRPTVNFDNTEPETRTIKSHRRIKRILVTSKNDVKKDGAMIKWIEKSASTLKAEGKSNNLLTGKPFNRNVAIKAVKQAIYLASSGE
jgi:hypothetical protein